MRRALIGAVLGSVVGAGFAALLALVIQLNQPRDPDEPYLQTISDGTSNGAVWWVGTRYSASWPPIEPSRRRESFLSGNLYLGLLLGAGPGAVVGTVVGATGAIVRALRESTLRTEAGLSPGQDETSP